MKNLFWIIFLLISITNIYCQQELILEKEGRIKVFSSSQNIKITLKTYENETQTFHDIYGKVSKITEDSLYMSTYFEKETKYTSKTKFRLYKDYREDRVVIALSRKAIKEVQKTRKANQTIQMLRPIITVSGIVTGITALIVHDDKNQEKLLLASAIQLGISGVLKLASYKRVYRINQPNSPQNWSITVK